MSWMISFLTQDLVIYMGLILSFLLLISNFIALFLKDIICMMLILWNLRQSHYHLFTRIFSLPFCLLISFWLLFISWTPNFTLISSFSEADLG